MSVSKENKSHVKTTCMTQRVADIESSWMTSLFNGAFEVVSGNSFVPAEVQSVIVGF